VYTLGNTPPPRERGISDVVISGEIYEKEIKDKGEIEVARVK
jgi:hypothetical protein